jgi:uncharacterized protein (TIGR00730 family)
MPANPLLRLVPDQSPKQPAFNLCVYCGSRLGLDQQFHQDAHGVGQWIGEHGGQLIYGGGKAGLMGVVAKATLNAGGRVVGIIPKTLIERELALDQCHELIVVDTMHERKQLMANRADAFLALPGGLGTLEELFEVWTWRQLGYHNKSIGILNTSNYFDPLLSFIRSSMNQDMVFEWQTQLVIVESDPTSLLPLLIQMSNTSEH